MRKRLLLAIVLLGILFQGDGAVAVARPAVVGGGSRSVVEDALATSTVLVIDISGSMNSLWQGGVKLDSAKNAATDLVTMIEQENQVGGGVHSVAVASFNNAPALDLAPTTDTTLAKTAIMGLVAAGGTNIGAGLQTAIAALQGASPASERFIILLSDGNTNDGLTPDEILAGPVQEAAASGICIYTVGFGEPGDLNEMLLRQIASASGCGEYYYASDAYQLQNIYVRLGHHARGQILDEYTGQVRQGETVTAGDVSVPAGQGELSMTLTWKGSALDLVVTDPKGRAVDENYSGATLVPYARFVYLIVQKPLAGIWRVAVYGRDVPEGILDYTLIASSRKGATTANTSGLLLPITVGLALAALLLATLALIRQRAIGSAPARPGRVAGLEVCQPGGPVWLVNFGKGPFNIGRDPRNHLVLRDNLVSRGHARISRGQAGWQITDLRSLNGTWVNDRRISQCLLRNGDRIRLGRILMIFRSRD